MQLSCMGVQMEKTIVSNIVLKPARRVEPGPSRPVAATRPGWRKNRKRKNRCDLVDPVKNPVATCWLLFFFVFLLKWYRFNFFLKKIDPEDLVTRSKPGTRALDQAGSKNYGLKHQQNQKLTVGNLDSICWQLTSCLRTSQKYREPGVLRVCLKRIYSAKLYNYKSKNIL
jgi:hypothetical protein